MPPETVIRHSPGPRPAPGEPPWRFKILYDGDCPYCMVEMRWLARRNRDDRLAFADITADDFDAAAFGKDHEQLMARIHGAYPDGRVIRGMEVFREAYAAVGKGWLLAPTGWPVLRWVFDGLYVLFAKNRVRLGRLFGRDCEEACELPEGVGQGQARGGGGGGR